MIRGTQNNIKLYKFRGKVFECCEHIVQKLNLALAYNRATDRYEEVKPSTTTEGRDREGRDN